ncbi:hypothetical protein PF005_g10392 [Phytophthora fragariae]|uniref:ZSWIM1/3 RNaseH-like domain-containing protein n=1 Tax=Phytophthora fragariae TaxID=53985 RepID=A0A6A4DRP5_9STRA|nr:hypothetical protein PF009_g11789 [Phytophthora fragariae]KAE9114658.1 hypothetical protein PF007_g10295 [Phytophthora fragariae]KAE9212928.1 hypothetical protein PF005_g10392 [Phytophthora fragariae]KAE9311437.1 hypothetical protein PF001_g9721 [Phytophthora fragariae]
MKNDIPSPPFHPSPTALGLSFWNLLWHGIHTRNLSGSEPERQVPSDSLPWVCPHVLVEWHEGWDAFRAYIKEYQAATHKIFRQRTSTSVTKRNRMNVTRRDVRNMISRMEEERRGGATTEEHLEAVLRGLCESRGNRATVFVDEDKRALTITLRAQQMRRWFKASPEVKLIDATHIDAAHNTNESSSCSW